MLLIARQTNLSPLGFVSESGDVFAVFDERSQDSGNISYGVLVGDRRFFVKTAGLDVSRTQALSQDQRVQLLRNAVRLHQSFTHPALPSLRNVVESNAGPILVYDWADGELLRSPSELRADPASTHARFRRLPVSQVLRVLDVILDLHHQLAILGWVAVDFYDGSLIYDFDAGALHVVDLDSYHFGPFVNRMGRMFGSTRFMSPEEFEAGARIDERSNVFVLGRTIVELLSDPTGVFRGSPELLSVAQRATSISRHERFPTIEGLSAAWAFARTRT